MAALRRRDAGFDKEKLGGMPGVGEKDTWPEAAVRCWDQAACVDACASSERRKVCSEGDERLRGLRAHTGLRPLRAAGTWWLRMNRRSSSFTSPPAPSASVTWLAPYKVQIT